MHSALLDPAAIDCDLASKFWTPVVSARPTDTFTARNLYELFVHELSSLVSGACQAHRVAHALYVRMPADQISLRRLALGLAKSSRACLPHLPVTLLDEGLVLPPAHDASVDALLSTIHPHVGGDGFESWSVVGARIVGVFHKVALHLEAQSVDATENAALLGSEPLKAVLGRWSSEWADYIVEVRAREPGFRAQAYAAGLSSNSNPVWQFA